MTTATTDKKQTAEEKREKWKDELIPLLKRLQKNTSTSILLDPEEKKEKLSFIEGLIAEVETNPSTGRCSCGKFIEPGRIIARLKLNGDCAICARRKSKRAMSSGKKIYAL